MYSLKEIIKIAKQLYDEGYFFSEALPIKRWEKLGYPNDPDLFKLIDTYLKLLREYDKYECEKKKSLVK